MLRYKYWQARSYLRYIMEYAYKNHISKEEAALLVIKKHQNDIKINMWHLKKFLEAYEIFEGNIKSMSRREKKDYSKIYIYPPKSKKNYNLFFKFYRAAKKDLKEKGRISKKTLGMIKRD